jgi:L-2-hydroxyglutarate oxidase
VARTLDVVIVGGGIIGLATAYQLLGARPDLRLLLLEKEAHIAAHQSGHNSGVMHAGLYYAAGSLKARLCREGKHELELFAEEHGIAFEHRGKLVVALDEREESNLTELEARARANGVPDIERVAEHRLREIEPHAAGIYGLWSPTTGVIDYTAVCEALARSVRLRGGTIALSREVMGVLRGNGELVVRTHAGDEIARNLIACAGLQSDRVARMTGDPATEQIVPFRGDYWRLAESARPLVRALLYPVPDPRFPFLGVHFTRRIDGEVLAGPNAVLAFAREGYRRRDVTVRDLASVVGSRRFVGLAARYWRMGSGEMARDYSKRLFHRSLRRYIPELQLDDLVPGPSGVRAQAVDPDGSLVDDFRLGGSEHVLHVRNAPSPAATASLAIGRVLVGEALNRFGYATSANVRP